MFRKPLWLERWVIRRSCPFPNILDICTISAIPIPMPFYHRRCHVYSLSASRAQAQIPDTGIENHGVLSNRGGGGSVGGGWGVGRAGGGCGPNVRSRGVPRTRPQHLLCSRRWRRWRRVTTAALPAARRTCKRGERGHRNSQDNVRKADRFGGADGVPSDENIPRALPVSTQGFDRFMSLDGFTKQ